MASKNGNRVKAVREAQATEKAAKAALKAAREAQAAEKAALEHARKPEAPNATADEAPVARKRQSKTLGSGMAKGPYADACCMATTCTYVHRV